MEGKRAQVVLDHIAPAGVAGAVLSADVEPAGVAALPGQVRQDVAAPEVV